MSDSAQQTINIPGLLVVALFSFLAIRWYLSSSSNNASPTATGTPGSARNAGGSRINPAHVDQLAQMFPQLARRDIMWDLQRNGGNIAATTERVLSGRGLEQPPQSFQPQPPASTAQTAQSGTLRSNANTPAEPIDLISRYNLSTKVSSPQAYAAEATNSKGGWAASKQERQSVLQRRREEMILAARRKMEERDRGTLGNN